MISPILACITLNSFYYGQLTRITHGLLGDIKSYVLYIVGSCCISCTSLPTQTQQLQHYWPKMCTCACTCACTCVRVHVHVCTCKMCTAQINNRSLSGLW